MRLALSLVRARRDLALKVPPSGQSLEWSGGGLHIRLNQSALPASIRLLPKEALDEFLIALP